MVDHPQIGQAIKKAGFIACWRLNALFKSAIGYEARETMRETLTDKSQYGDTVTVKEHHNAAYTAQRSRGDLHSQEPRSTAWR